MKGKSFIYLLVLGFLVAIAQAALVIQSPTTSVSGMPGATVTGEFLVNNTSPTTSLVNIDISDTHPYTISFSPDIFNLGPLQSRTVSFSVMIPNTATVGTQTGNIRADDGTGNQASFILTTSVLDNNKNLSYVGSTITQTANPGEEISGTFQIKNERNEAVTATMTGIIYHDSDTLNVNSKSVSFNAFETKTITYTISSSSNDVSQTAGVYSGNISFSYAGGSLKVPMIVTIAEDPAIDVVSYTTTNPLSVQASQGQTKTTSFRINNAGNTERVDNIAITYNPSDFQDASGNKINVSFSPDTGISVISSSSISTKLQIPDDMDPMTYDGIVTVSNGIVSDQFALEVEVQGPLVIKDIDLDDDKLRPGEDLTFTVKIYNDASDRDFDMDVDLDVWLSDSKTYDEGDIAEDEDNDEIEDDSSFTLDAGDDYRDADDEDVEFTFTMPRDADDGDEFYVQARAEGDADNGQTYITTYVSDSIEIEKERHELEIYRFDIIPESVKCQRNAAIDFGIRNIGRSDEDDAVLKITSGNLGINIIQSIPELDSDYDKSDNDYENTFQFTVPTDTPSDTYIIDFEVRYDNNNERISGTRSFVVGECEKTSTSPKDEEPTSKEPTENNESRTTIDVNYQGNNPVIPQTVVVPVPQEDQNSEEQQTSVFDQAGTYVYLLLALVVVLVVVFVSILIKVVRG